MKKATGHWGIGSAVVAVVALSALLARGKAQYLDLSGGRVLPDFGLGVGDIAAHLDGLSGAAVSAYRWGVGLPDLFYPAALALLLRLLARRAGLTGRFLWLPVLAAAVDYAENAGIWMILAGAPGGWLGPAVSLATHLKFALYAGAVLNVLLHIDRVAFPKPR